MGDSNGRVPKGALQVAAAVVAGVAAIGFLTGTQGEPENRAHAPLDVHHVETTDSGLTEAKPYWELRRTPRGQRSGWSEDVAKLRERSPGLFDAFEPGDEKAALARRAALRAYDGAPPRIPHAVRQDSAPECLACHQDGLRIGDRVAAAMSHEPYVSCTQCHVVDEAPMPGGADLEPDPRDVTNSFVGMASPERGPRAWEIAPPQIPHRTFMRERCDACHGVDGPDAIRSSHPYRQSCTQCHAPAAEVERVPFLEAG